jgi:hypothetical protein
METPVRDRSCEIGRANSVRASDQSEARAIELDHDLSDLLGITKKETRPLPQREDHERRGFMELPPLR